MTQQPKYIKPGFLMKNLFGPLFVRLGSFPVLTVTGRTSGQPRSVPIGAPIEVDGKSYLLSGRGPTQWIRNLRTAGCGTLRVKGKTRAFTAVEVDGAERDKAIAVFRAHFGKSVDAYFTELPDPADHPTFRLEFEPELPEA